MEQKFPIRPIWSDTIRVSYDLDWKCLKVVRPTIEVSNFTWNWNFNFCSEWIPKFNITTSTPFSGNRGFKHHARLPGTDITSASLVSIIFETSRTATSWNLLTCLPEAPRVLTSISHVPSGCDCRLLLLLRDGLRFSCHCHNDLVEAIGDSLEWHMEAELCWRDDKGRLQNEPSILPSAAFRC